MAKIISPIKNPGGSAYKLKHILPAITWKRTYVEPCAGGLNVLLGSPKYTRDGHPITKYAFDKNALLINTWKFIRDEPVKLRNFLQNTSYDRENFEFACKYINQHENNIDEECQKFMLAAMFCVQNRFSRAADHKTFGWSDRLRRGKPEYISAWETMTESLIDISRVIEGVTFDSGDCIDLITKYYLHEDPDVVFFFDPPFVHDTRKTPTMYGRYEMETRSYGSKNATTHESLLVFIKQCIAGTSYVLGYDNELYRNYLGEPQYTWVSKCSASQSKNKPIRRDCLWCVH